MNLVFTKWLRPTYAGKKIRNICPKLSLTVSSPRFFIWVMGRRAARARSDRWRGRELEFANAHAERDCVKEGSADAERTPRRRRAGGPTQARSQAGRCTSQFALLQILVATAVLPLLSLRGEDEGKFGERIGGIVEGRAGVNVLHVHVAHGHGLENRSRRVSRGGNGRGERTLMRRRGGAQSSTF